MGSWKWEERIREALRLYQNKNIVIYGTGKNAERLLNVLEGFHVVGLMDGERTDGYQWNRKILSAEEVVELDTDVIVIAARPCVTEEIYRRIFGFCRQNHIALLHMYGTDLMSVFSEITRQNAFFFERNKDELWEKLIQYEKISFDIFDTLLMRTVYEPEDMFDIVEARMKKYGIYMDGFSQKRTDAEIFITCTTHNGSPNIDTIYKKMTELYRLDSRIGDRIKEIELQVFKEVLIPRTDMIEIYRQTIEQGKPVYLISDMYMPGSVLRRILSSYGIEGYQELFVSCDYQDTKGGKLFEIYQQNSPVGSAAHVGDNRISDGIMPGIYGIDGCLIKKASDMQKATRVFDRIQINVLTKTEGAILGQYLSKAFNSPFALYGRGGRLHVASYCQAAELFLAPLVSVFVFWLCATIKKERRMDGILFSGRDGYLIRKMYDYVRHEYEPELPESFYFETSRNACVGAGIKDLEELRGIAGIDYDGTPEEMLQKRFGLSLQECMPRMDEETIEDYIVRHQEIIDRHSEEMREGYRRYADSLGLKEEGNYLFYDFVSSGTCQYYLEKIMPFHIEGIYFGRVKAPDELNTYTKAANKNSLKIDALFQSGNPEEDDQYFFKNYLFAELIMTSSRPSLQSIGREGKPIYLPEKRSREELQMIEAMQEVVWEFFVNVCKTADLAEIPGRKLALELYRLKESYSSDWDVKELESYLFLDDFGQIHVPLNIN